MSNVVKDVQIINVANSQKWTIENEEDDEDDVENETDEKDSVKKQSCTKQNDEKL